MMAKNNIVWGLVFFISICGIDSQYQYGRSSTSQLQRAISGQVDQMLQQFKREETQAVARAKSSYISELQAVRDEYLKRLGERDARIAQLEKLKDGLHCETENQTNVISFNARIESFKASSTKDTKIQFKLIDMNVGGAFYKNGSFISPVRGLYSFSFEVSPDTLCGTNRMCVGLYQDSKLTSTSCCRWPNGCGTTIIMQLPAGSEVWLAVSASGSGCYQFLSGRQYNKFSGNLLQRQK